MLSFSASSSAFSHLDFKGVDADDFQQEAGDESSAEAQQLTARITAKTSMATSARPASTPDIGGEGPWRLTKFGSTPSCRSALTPRPGAGRGCHGLAPSIIGFSHRENNMPRQVSLKKNASGASAGAPKQPAKESSKPTLPHERDEKVGATGGVTSPTVQQAARDVERGISDTSGAPEADAAYRKLKK